MTLMLTLGSSCDTPANEPTTDSRVEAFPSSASAVLNRK